VISPLLAVFTGSLGLAELNDATTLFSICQRIAGSLGVGLIAAIYARQAATSGAITALHQAGILIAALAAGGLLAAPMLPAEGNQIRYGPVASADCADDCNRIVPAP
jgi:hypothetical protein